MKKNERSKRCLISDFDSTLHVNRRAEEKSNWNGRARASSCLSVLVCFGHDISRIYWCIRKKTNNAKRHSSVSFHFTSMFEVRAASVECVNRANKTWTSARAPQSIWNSSMSLLAAQIGQKEKKKPHRKNRKAVEVNSSPIDFSLSVAFTLPFACLVLHSNRFSILAFCAQMTCFFRSYLDRSNAFDGSRTRQSTTLTSSNDIRIFGFRPSQY